MHAVRQFERQEDGECRDRLGRQSCSFDRGGEAAKIVVLHLGAAEAEFVPLQRVMWKMGDSLSAWRKLVYSGFPAVTRPEQAHAQLERLEREFPSADVLVLGHTHRPLLHALPGGTLSAERVTHQARTAVFETKKKTDNAEVTMVPMQPMRRWGLSPSKSMVRAAPAAAAIVAPRASHVAAINAAPVSNG